MTAFMTLTLILSASIYRCHIPGEPVMFTDLPCRDGVSVTVAPGQTVALAPLTEAELARLQALSKGTEQLRREQARRKQKSRARAEAAAEADRAACADARNQLNALKLKRRKGYSLAEAVKLGKQADRLREIVRASC